MLGRIGRYYSAHARERRARMLRARLALSGDHRVLDLGGGDGSHFHCLYPHHRNVVVADLDPDALKRARKQFGYETVQLDGTGRLPFADGHFDFVFCSSVIEHVTGPKAQMVKMTDGAEFSRIAWLNQVQFASEIRRVGKRFWVQTPNRYFLIESHSWLPGPVVFLPRPFLVSMLKLFATFWPKATLPDWHLLDEEQMRALFPGSEIIKELSLGFTKSLIAFKP